MPYGIQRLLQDVVHLIPVFIGSLELQFHPFIRVWFFRIWIHSSDIDRDGDSVHEVPVRLLRGQVDHVNLVAGTEPIAPRIREGCPTGKFVPVAEVRPDLMPKSANRIHHLPSQDDVSGDVFDMPIRDDPGVGVHYVDGVAYAEPLVSIVGPAGKLVDVTVALPNLVPRTSDEISLVTEERDWVIPPRRHFQFDGHRGFCKGEIVVGIWT